MHSLDFVSVLIHIPSTKTHSGCEMCSSPLKFHLSVAFALRSWLSKCQPAARSRLEAVSSLVAGLQRCLEFVMERVHQTPCSRSSARILSAMIDLISSIYEFSVPKGLQSYPKQKTKY